MTIRVKLLLLSIFPVIFLVYISVMMLNEMGELNESAKGIYDKQLIPLVELKRISDLLTDEIVDQVSLSQAGLAKAGDAAESLKNAQVMFNEQWLSYKKGEKSAEEIEIITLIDQQAEIASKEISRIEEKLTKMAKIFKSGDVNGKLGRDIKSLYTVSEPVKHSLFSLVQLKTKLAEYEMNNISRRYDDNIKNLFYTLAAILIVLALIISVIYRSIRKPIYK